MNLRLLFRQAFASLTRNWLRSVLPQFLSEAVALSMLGGTLGMLAGVLSSAAVERLFEFPTKLAPEMIAIGGLFAALIGIIFGYYPARRASKLDPIQGLRYE
jgi:ABC-type antimicrobial peptide transport system permease subunit